MKEFIRNNLFTKKCSLDSNKLKKEWFVKNGHEKEYEIIDSVENAESLGQKIYNLYHNIETPKCKFCGINFVKFKKFSLGYFDYCSCKCSANSPEKQEKVKETNLSRYNVEFPSKSQVVQEKIKNTNLERYGVESPFQATEVQEKIKNTNLERYGAGNNRQQNISPEMLSLLEDKTWLYNEHHNKEKSLVEIGLFLGVTRRTVLNYFNKHDITAKRFATSVAEKEIFDFLSEYTTVQPCRRDIISPKELDLFLPEYNIAIEHNGLYWHDSERIDKDYHINKTNLCKSKGIKLIHIFEDEWVHKKEIVKSILLSKMGIYEKRIFARNCVVKKVNNKQVRDFVDNNHIQGNTKASSYYCLYYKNEIVSVASVGKGRFRKNTFELIRYCTKLNHVVIGGFSKLLSVIKKDYNEIYSYADLRYFTGEIYSKFGTYIKTTEPGYYWTDFKIRISRYRTQKKKLLNLLGDDYNEKLTENENMISQGYSKIYDCGHDLFLL